MRARPVGSRAFSLHNCIMTHIGHMYEHSKQSLLGLRRSLHLLSPSNIRSSSDGHSGVPYHDQVRMPRSTSTPYPYAPYP